MFRGLGAWHFYFTPIPVDDWNYIPGEATIQESNSILPRTKAAGKAWSKEVSGYIQALDEIQETNSLYLVGVDRQDDFIMAVNQKKANVIISQNGYEVGDLAVTTVFKALTGNSIPEHTYISNEIITQQNAAMYLPKEQGGL